MLRRILGCLVTEIVVSYSDVTFEEHMWFRLVLRSFATWKDEVGKGLELPSVSVIRVCQLSSNSLLCFLWAVCSPICLVCPYEACVFPCWPLLVGCSGFRSFSGLPSWLCGQLLNFPFVTHLRFPSLYNTLWLSSCISVLCLILHQHQPSSLIVALEWS